MESQTDPVIVSQLDAPEDVTVVSVLALAKDAPEPDLTTVISIPVVETLGNSLAETPSAVSVPDLASPTGSSDALTELSSPDIETSWPPVMPEIQIFSPDDPALSTRPGTPASFVSTAPTTVSQLSDDHLDDGARSPKPIPSTPLVLDAEVDDGEITALSLSPPVFAAKPSQRGRSAGRGVTARSLPGSPIVNPLSSPVVEPLSSPIQRLSKSCPTSPELQPTAVPPGPKRAQPKNPFHQAPSRAAQIWDERKKMGETSKILDELMLYQGLEEVKRQFLDIKSKVDICEKQDRDLKQERFNVVFQGNPGTGKTTIARLYAKFLVEMGLLKPDSHFKETSGIKVASKGPKGIKKTIKTMITKRNGGALFVDEAYQLTATYIDALGRPALDILLTSMENHIGSLVVIFVGYKDEMEPFFEHNPGLASRIPYTMHFSDFTDGELWRILRDNINRQYHGRMKVEGGMDGLYMRIAIRRLAQARGSRGFGNARAVENLLARISQRQTQRITQQKLQLQPGNGPLDYFLLTKEDLIGPDPSEAAKQCQAWVDLQGLIGLEHVKKCVRSMIGMIKLNYQRELLEMHPLKFSLNQLFVGAPGAGKTTVAKLYGKILADLGYLSRGDVVLKTPADFIGECLGKSEAKTKKILETTVGKILVIDEAYMLDAGDPGKDQDKFKTGVIDTLVSMIQGVPGEDRCIILVGYEDKIRTMFQNVNPGLSRRFPIERPFRFENFTLDQLEQILQYKMREQDLSATADGVQTARDIFERSLMRPNFSNAGEVDSVLATAKMNFEARQSQIPAEKQNSVLEAVDFDPEFDRGRQLGLDCRQVLDGRVHRDIVERLASYQNRCMGARQCGLDPRSHVPTNFVFKGFPGTGKTTTAQNMGKLFYSMGFLSTAEVIECSAIDLIGQFVGQTAPKTRKKLNEGIGKVLFIDEAWRLAGGTFAAEAVDELIHFLTQPSNQGRMIVILAGFVEEMNKLMTVQPILSGLFPEEIFFDNIPAEDCMKLLARELELNQTVTEDNFLGNSGSDGYKKVKRLFHVMQVIPTWSNARDIKNLAKTIVGRFLESSNPTPQQARTLSADQIIDSMKSSVLQQRQRLTASGNRSVPRQPPIGSTDSAPALGSPQLAPPMPISPLPADICTPGAGGPGTCTAGDSTHIAMNLDTQQDTSLASASFGQVAKLKGVPGVGGSQGDDSPGDGDGEAREEEEEEEATDAGEPTSALRLQINTTDTEQDDEQKQTTVEDEAKVEEPAQAVTQPEAGEAQLQAEEEMEQPKAQEAQPKGDDAQQPATQQQETTTAEQDTVQHEESKLEGEDEDEDEDEDENEDEQRPHSVKEQNTDRHRHRRKLKNKVKAVRDDLKARLPDLHLKSSLQVRVEAFQKRVQGKEKDDEKENEQEDEDEDYQHGPNSCVNGFTFRSVGDGYRCDGGEHFYTLDEWDRRNR